MAPSVAVVLPSNRPEMIGAWYKAWKPYFGLHDAMVVLVEDNDKPTPGLLHVSEGTHFCRKDVPAFIPTGTGAIRSWGFLAAWKWGFDVVVTMDDDVLPAEDPDVIGAYLRGFETMYPVSPYFDVGGTFGLGHAMRGVPPPRWAKPMVQYGGWDGVPDWGGEYQQNLRKLGIAEDGYHFDRKNLAVPHGIPFTGCIMNTAFTRDAIPMMYQLVMGMDRVGYDRWDDIWSGLLAKVICDRLRVPIVINGHATIHHSRASNPDVNAAKEAGGDELNNHFWDRLKSYPLRALDVATCYAELAEILPPAMFGDRGHVITEGMRQWIAAFA